MNVNPKVVKVDGSGNTPATPPLPKLLMVENEKTDVLMMQQVVRGRYRLFSAPNASDAMKILVTEKNISLILMDIGLPFSKSGDELAADLKKSPQFGSIPILGLSAYNKEERWDDLFVEYMQKPYDLGKLSAKIDQYAMPLVLSGQ